MGILIGMDEAGYGPNLGPLVVAATAWQVNEVRGQGSGVREKQSPRLCRGIGSSNQVAVAPSWRTDAGEVDLYKRLRKLVSRAPKNGRLAIADSKALYRPGLGLSPLERGVHAALAALDRWSASWSSIVTMLSADPQGERHRLPWHEGFDCPLPVDTAADEVARLGARLAEACGASGVRLVAMRARLMFPAEFNELTEHHGSKGAALSHVTIGLLQETLGALAAGVEANGPPAKPGANGRFAELEPRQQSPDHRSLTPMLVVCDKHGGRNRYSGLLQYFFPDRWIETLVESRAESRYHWGADDGRVEVAFRQGGESFLPAALASMTAKYLRELAMRAENAFWCARVPGLRPTAGYPLDARRFKADIQAAQRELRIDDHVLWRNR